MPSTKLHTYDPISNDKKDRNAKHEEEQLTPMEMIVVTGSVLVSMICFPHSAAD